MARYQCGEENRMALLEAALGLFAEKGLKGASVRDITQKAGASLSSVNYHFGNKQQLYLDCIAYVVSEKFAFARLVSDLLESNPGTPLEMSEALCKLVDDLSRHVLSPDASDQYGRFVARVMMDIGKKESDIIEKVVPFGEFEKQLLRCCPNTDLIDVNLGILTLMGHSCNLLMAKTIALGRLRKQDFDEEAIERVVRHQQRTILNALNLPPAGGADNC